MKAKASLVPEIRKRDSESGTLYLRDGVTFALFFKGVSQELAEGLTFALDTFLEMVPAQALRWASVGASSEEWKPYAKTTEARCKSQLRYSAMIARDFTSFELRDGDDGGEAPGYGLAVFADSDPSEEPGARNLLQLYFPASVIEPDNVEAFLEKILSVAKRVPFISGYCSPGLHWSEGMVSTSLLEARKLAFRYPGFDVQFNELGRDDIDDKVRGARWLTFLGPELTLRLGGSSLLREQLPNPIDLQAIGEGVLIRASELPEIGDVNRQEGTPCLRKVARALEPVTQFSELVLLRYEFADNDEHLLERWERRFLVED